MTITTIGLLVIILPVFFAFAGALAAILSTLQAIRTAVNAIQTELGSLSNQLERISGTLDDIYSDTLRDEPLPGDDE
jgi:hypothetical protein